MGTLTQASNQGRARVIEHMDRLPGLADDIERGSDDAATRLAEEHEFLVASLLPLTEDVERTIYPELDRLLSCRLAMTPMEREHAEMRVLVERIGRMRADPAAPRAAIAADLRRLHALVSSHLAEESSYARILDHNLDRASAEALPASMGHAAASV